MKKMKKKPRRQGHRLLKLARLLEADAKNKKGIKFHLGVWGECNSDDEPDVSCGTQACAMGLAALSGAFAKDGLKYKIESEYSGLTEKHFPVISVHVMRSYGFRAAAKLFGISYTEACWLFSPWNYDGATPVGSRGEMRVARRIRRFVSRTELPPKDTRVEL